MSTEIQKIPKKWYQRKLVIIPAVLLVIFILIGALGNSNPAPSSPARATPTGSVATPSSPVISSQENKVKLTMVTFQQIKTGQTLAEVEAIIGKGTLSTESEVMGSKSELYTFSGEGFGTMATLNFTNGKVMSKSQFGLK